MINPSNTYSLTDFCCSASHYIEQIRAAKVPVVLTVQGEAAVVVQDIHAFQQLWERLQSVEEELRALKLDALHQAVVVGIDQLEGDDWDEYDEANLSTLFDDIKIKGRKGLAERNSGIAFSEHDPDL